MQRIQSVGIVVKRNDPVSLELSQAIEAWLAQRGIKILRQNSDHNFALFAAADLVLSIGGDGSMVRTARRLVGEDIPLAGVNTGRVGFLPELTPENWQSCLEAAITKGLALEKRMALEMVVTRGDAEVFSSVAVNDVVISRGGIARLLAFDLQAGASKLLYLRADGLIISSPTGATAYSSSAGGPLLYPTMNAYTVTAICPFMSNMAPLVLGQEMVLSVTICEAGSKTYATIDGQEVFRLQAGDAMRVYGLPGGITFASFGVSDYFSKLRSSGLVADSPGSRRG